MPLLPWIIFAIAAGALSALAGWRINRYLRGDPEMVALVGRTGTGKSTLLYYMENGEIPEVDLESTTTMRRSERIQVHQKTFAFEDTSGSELSQWIDAVRDCRSVFYLFDASLVAKEDPGTLNWIDADVEHIRKVLPRSRSRHFTLIGTHADLFTEPRENEAEVRGHPVITRLAKVTKSGKGDLAIGSMADNKEAGRLVDKAVKSQQSRR